MQDGDRDYGGQTTDSRSMLDLTTQLHVISSLCLHTLLTSHPSTLVHTTNLIYCYVRLSQLCTHESNKDGDDGDHRQPLHTRSHHSTICYLCSLHTYICFSYVT